MSKNLSTWFMNDPLLQIEANLVKFIPFISKGNHGHQILVVRFTLNDYTYLILIVLLQVFFPLSQLNFDMKV